MHKIGRYSYGDSLKVVSHEGVNLTVGAFCSIGPNVKFVLGENHRTDCITTYPFGHIHVDVFGMPLNDHPRSNGDIVIGNDVWIGMGVTIMSGVTVGDGAVIAANSHVVKDVEPYEIVGGNPARYISFRFPAETRELLLKLKWWDKTDAEIRELLPVLLNKPDFETLQKLCE